MQIRKRDGWLVGWLVGQAQPSVEMVIGLVLLASSLTLADYCD